MATASVTNTFVSGTTINPSAVNTNFSDILTFLNNSVIHIDGSKQMTAALNLKAGTDPSSSDHAARKAYVDAADLLRLQTKLTSANANTPTGASFTPASTQLRFIAEAPTGTTNASGFITITFPDSGFATGIVAVIPAMGDTASGAAVHCTVVNSSTSRTAFAVLCTRDDGTAIVSGAVRVSYIAVGW